MNESEARSPAVSRAHRLRRMAGRDPHERHRVATPLELLFDLTFVIAFGIAAAQFSHLLATGHVGAGLTAFLFATFAVSWAWINFTWFASAYDTDDWIYRLTTMVQMVGVLVLALGLPAFFASIEHGEHVDNTVLVAGYVVMRIAMVAQWLRAARQDPARRSACLTYATVITVVQIGWIAAMFLALPVAVGLVVFVLLALSEMVGTVASLSAVVDEHGWTADAVLLVVAGTGLTFGMWWVYFVVPAGDLLHRRREASFPFGYLHVAVFGAIVATGAGLHAAAYYLEERSELGEMGTVLSVAIPVGVFIGLVFVIYGLLVGAVDMFHVLLVTLTAAVLVAAVLLAYAGVSMAVCLLVVTLAPVVTVVASKCAATSTPKRCSPQATSTRSRA